MTALTEGLHAGEHLVSEANGTLSREQVTVGGGVKSSPATVMGKITIGAETTAAGTNTGNGAFGAVTLAAGVLAGVYKVKMTKATANAGDFEVIDPEGDVVGLGTVGVAFTGGGLSFTIADGATDFVVGDNWTLTVAAGSNKRVPLNLSATDGSQNADCILYDWVDASAADVRGVVHSRICEVNGNLLIWPVGITDPQKASAIDQLRAKHIIVRY